MLTVRLSTLQIARRVSHGREELADECLHGGSHVRLRSVGID